MESVWGELLNYFMVLENLNATTETLMCLSL